MANYRHVAALGSSFAAGPGIPPIVDRFAMRSGRNYAHVLADRLGARLTDLTVSGATTTNILERQQRVLIRKFPPQLEGVPRDADLVTITAGGNDVSYLGSMTRLAWANWLRARRPTRLIGAALGAKPIPPITAADVGRAAFGLARTVEGVRARASNARVLLVDYLSVVGENTMTAAAIPLDEAAISVYRTIGEQLAEAFAAAAGTSGAELVRVSELSRAHALGSEDPGSVVSDRGRPSYRSIRTPPGCGRSPTRSCARFGRSHRSAGAEGQDAPSRTPPAGCLATRPAAGRRENVACNAASDSKTTVAAITMRCRRR
jgi:lysophospholipase L1-like esterase